MRVLGIRLVNIRTYKDNTIVIPLNGVTVIHGENGAGKTTIFMALQYAFFGAARGYVGRSAFQGFSDPTVNDLLRVGTARGYVRVLFEQSGRVYLIERSVSSSGQSGGYLVECRFVGDGVECPSQRVLLNTEALNQKVLGVLGLSDVKNPRDLFTSTIYIPQFNMHEILTLRDDERRELLNAALGLTEYSRIYRNIERLAGSGEVGRLRKDSIIGSEVYALRNRIEELERRMSKLDPVSKKRRVEEIRNEMPELERLLSQVESEIQMLEAERRVKDGELGRVKAELDSLKKVEDERVKLIKKRESVKSGFNEVVSEAIKALRLDGLKAEAEDVRLVDVLNDVKSGLNGRLSKVEEEIKSLEESLEALIVRRDELVSVRSQLSSREGELRGRIASLENALRMKRDEADEVKELVSQGVCPKCRQKIAHEHGRRLLKEVEKSVMDLEDELVNLRQKLKDLEEEIGKTDELMKQVESEVKKVEGRLNDLRREKDEVSGALAFLNTSLTRLESLQNMLAEVEKQFNELPDVGGLRRKLNEEKENIQKELREIEERLKFLERKRKELVEEKARKEAEERQCLRDIDEAAEVSKNLAEAREKLNTLTRMYGFVGSKLEEIAKAFEDRIKGYLLEEFKTILRDYYDVIFGGQGFNTDVDNEFRPVFRDVEGRELTQPSGAQVTALALAYRLALNSVVRVANKKLEDAPLILDEPTVGFDSERVSSLANLLKSLRASKDSGIQVIVVTHAEELLDSGNCKIKLKTVPERPAPKAEVSEVTCMDSGVEGLSYQDYHALVRTVLMS